MILIVGLGNPGKIYKSTRHNIGRMAVGKWRMANNFPDFKLDKKSKSLISEGVFGNDKVILALPETFMNNSGKAVKMLSTNYLPAGQAGHLPAPKIWVVHDDIDLQFGKIKIVKNRGSAGHKGVESIIKELKNKNFVRFRLGILPQTGKPEKPENFVLEKFKKEDEKILEETIDLAKDAVETGLKEGLEKAMNKFNK